MNGSVLIVLGVLFMLAFLVETLVEFLFAPLFNNIKAIEKFKWVQLYIAVVVAVIGAFIYQFDLLYLLARFLAQLVQAEPVVMMTPYGIAITGIAIGHGAGYLHDAVAKYFRKPELPAGTSQ